MAPLYSWRVVAAGISYLLFGLGASIPALVSLCLKVLPLQAARRQVITRGVIRGLCRFYVMVMGLMGLYRLQFIRHYQGEIRGQLVIANHPMLLDAVFIMAFLPNVCCIAKPQLAQNPFTRLTLAQAGFLVSEDTDLVEQVSRKLAAGENVLIFPEGTRSDRDSELVFRRGAANLAVICDCSMLPVVIRSWPCVLQKHQKWYQLPAERSQISLTVEPPMTVADCVDTSAPRTIQYRTLTRYLQQFFQQRLAGAG